jgi:hypothetical protein
MGDRFLERAATAEHEAIELSKSHVGLLDTATSETLEEAFSQIVSARDKIIALCSLILGIPCLLLYKNGVRFLPSEKLVKAKLSLLGSSHNAAGRLKGQLDTLNEHSAIALRNQITHALSPLQGVAPTCWLRVWDVDDDGNVIGEASHLQLVGREVADEDGNVDTLWPRAITFAEDGLSFVIEATLQLSKLVRSIGELAPPPTVYALPDNKLVIEKP